MKQSLPAVSMADSSKKIRRRVWRKRIVALSIGLVVVGVPITIFGFGSLILGAYDDSHRISLICNVDSVESGTASSQSTKGIGSSQPQVLFHTDCGNLILSKGVYRDNMDTIADRIEQGQKYRYEIGDGSYSIRGVLKIFKVAPTIYNYRKLQLP